MQSKRFQIFNCLYSLSDKIIGNLARSAYLNTFFCWYRTNSEFKIIKKIIAGFEYFRIFNRWGNIVFETNDTEQGWKSAVNGVFQPFQVCILCAKEK